MPLLLVTAPSLSSHRLPRGTRQGYEWKIHTRNEGTTEQERGVCVCVRNEPHYGHLGAASGKNREKKTRKTMRKKGNKKTVLSYSSCLVAEYVQLLGGGASPLAGGV